MSSTEAILNRIDSVLARNTRIEYLHIALTTTLFLLGISCFATALVTGQFVWATPSVITTGLLYWPLREIRDIREKNIALATVPMLIGQLPADKAAMEIQKLISRLFGDGRR